MLQRFESSAIQGYFEKGLENGGEMFEDVQFFSTMCVVAANEGYKGLKLKPEMFRGGPKIRSKNAVQRIFAFMLRAEGADDKEFQQLLLKFLLLNQGSKRDFMISECLESFIDFSGILEDPDILQLLYDISRSFGEQELRVVAEALQLKQMNNVAFLLFFAVMHSVCSRFPPDDVWQRTYVDPESKDTFPKQSQFFTEVVNLMSRRMTLKSEQKNREILRVLLVLMSLFIPSDCRDAFIENAQSKFRNLGWAETHSATPADWKE